MAQQQFTYELAKYTMQVSCYEHTMQAQVGSMGRVSSAIALCLSFSTPYIKYC